MGEYIIAPEVWEGPDFVLRCYRPGDGALFHEAARSSYEHLKDYMPWARPDGGSLEDVEQLARSARGRYLLATDFMVAVVSPQGDRFLGGTGFHLNEGPLSQRNAEVGMWIRADASGQGLGTRVLAAMLRWGFTEWPWLRLTWRCDSRNLASAKVAERNHMQLEAVLRNHIFDHHGYRRDTMCFAAWREQYMGG